MLIIIQCFISIGGFGVVGKFCHEIIFKILNLLNVLLNLKPKVIIKCVNFYLNTKQSSSKQVTKNSKQSHQICIKHHEDWLTFDWAQKMFYSSNIKPPIVQFEVRNNFA